MTKLKTDTPKTMSHNRDFISVSQKNKLDLVHSFPSSLA